MQIQYIYILVIYLYYISDLEEYKYRAFTGKFEIHTQLMLSSAGLTDHS